MNKHLQLVAPCNENRQVEPGLRRLANAEMRSREYLVLGEIEKLIKAAKDGRWAHRDATLILVGYRHGLRAVELAGLQWDQVEFGRSARLHVRRAKGGTPSVHPIQGDELRMLTALRREYPESGYVFTTERGTPFTPDAVNRQAREAPDAYSLPYVATFDGLRLGKPRRRHSGNSSLVGACLNHTYHQIHGVEFGALQGLLLAGLIPNPPAPS